MYTSRMPNLSNVRGPMKGRAMILFILLPLLVLVSAVGVFSMTFEDPDRVASNFSPYVEIGR